MQEKEGCGDVGDEERRQGQEHVGQTHPLTMEAPSAWHKHSWSPALRTGFEATGRDTADDALSLPATARSTRGGAGLKAEPNPGANMISIGRLIAVGATAMAVRTLWKKSHAAAPKRNSRRDRQTVEETQPSVNTSALAEEKPSLQ